ncbi:MAG: hypothetical protein PHO91_02160 [Patescibacteria group bacterium]|nr:hypothetical protein [Patescibacteria group bacterium]
MIFSLIIRDFFRTALTAWLLLVIFEILKPGAVHRLINLEYYFYSLIFIFIFYRLLKK